MMKMKRTLAVLVVAGLALSACGKDGQVEQLNQQGNAAFANQDYAAATTAYGQALAESAATTENSVNAAVAYNLANTHYRQEEYEQAQVALQAALPAADAELTAKGHYNIGNALYSSEQYEGAAEAYKEVLRLEPADVDAKHNLELALSKLQQEQQNQDQQNQDQQNQDQQNQDQQNQDQQNQDQQNQDQQNQDQQNQDQQNQAGGSGEQKPADPNAQPGQAIRVDGLTKQQARQMLVAAAQGTKTLQEYLQQVYVFPSGAVEKDW